jgi:hypothetical protein
MTIQVMSAAHCLAMLRARGEVKDAIKRRGEKPTHYSAAQITALAQAWLAEHRDDLVPPAIETITAWMLAGQFGKRAQRAAAALATRAEGQQATEIVG